MGERHPGVAEGSAIDISVVMPAYNAEATVGQAIRSLGRQSVSPAEVLLVDDCSTDRTAAIAEECGATVIRTKTNSGPAAARNLGIKTARGEIIAFMDADCVADVGWCEAITANAHRHEEAVFMGRTQIPHSTFLGDCIAGLGFPAGGQLGFEKMWHVDENGLTNSISSCNFAAYRSVFEEHGYFDDTFPVPGGEDTEFAHRLTVSEVRIRFCPDMMVHHEPCTSLRTFCRRHVTRGRGNYHIRKRVGDVSGLLRLRLWSTWNMIRTYSTSIKLPVMLGLLASAFWLQQYGYVAEWWRERSRDSRAAAKAGQDALRPDSSAADGPAA